MTPTLALVLVAALVVGALIGSVGIGGVLLPPALVYAGGLGFHLAAGTSVWAFLFAGAAGTWSYARRGGIDWRMAAWLGAGVVPTAVAGAWANAALPEGLLMALLAALMVATGADALLRRPAAERTRRFGAPALLAIGALVGFGSALTGTGGAVLLVPVLLLLRAPVLAAVGVAQAVSLPVVVFSTAGYVLYGSVDFVLGTAVGLVAVVGVVAGVRIAHAARAATLRRVVATALLCVGLLIAAQAAWGSLLGGITDAGAPSERPRGPSPSRIREPDGRKEELLLPGRSVRRRASAETGLFFVSRSGRSYNGTPAGVACVSVWPAAKTTILSPGACCGRPKPGFPEQTFGHLALAPRQRLRTSPSGGPVRELPPDGC